MEKVLLLQNMIFERTSLVLYEEWICAFLNTLPGQSLISSTLEFLSARVFDQVLVSNLSDIVKSGSPSIMQTSTSPTVVPKSLLLQIVSYHDIGIPLQKRLEDILESEDEPIELPKDSKETKWILTDGCIYLVAINSAPVITLDNYFKETKSLVGVKLLIRDAVIFHGTLLLENLKVQILGGSLPVINSSDESYLNEIREETCIIPTKPLKSSQISSQKRIQMSYFSSILAQKIEVTQYRIKVVLVGLHDSCTIDNLLDDSFKLNFCDGIQTCFVIVERATLSRMLKMSLESFEFELNRAFSEIQVDEDASGPLFTKFTSLIQNCIARLSGVALIEHTLSDSKLRLVDIHVPTLNDIFDLDICKSFIPKLDKA